MGAGDEAEAFVLYKLETFDGRGRVVGIYNGRRIVEKRADHRLERLNQTLLVVSKGRVRESS